MTHMIYATHLNNLAGVIHAQGRYEEAGAIRRLRQAPAFAMLRRGNTSCQGGQISAAYAEATSRQGGQRVISSNQLGVAYYGLRVASFLKAFELSLIAVMVLVKRI